MAAPNKRGRLTRTAMRRLRIPTEKLPGEVARYEKILTTYWKADVRHDPIFQRLFNGFYQVRRGSEWREHFYRVLEELKNSEQTFGQVLQDLFKSTGRIEASFASKALATRYPEQPIIDKWVRKFLQREANLRLLPGVDRIERWMQFHDQMAQWYRSFGSSPDCLKCIRRFDEICPGRSVCDLKKLDFVIYITQGNISLL